MLFEIVHNSPTELILKMHPSMDYYSVVELIKETFPNADIYSENWDGYEDAISFLSAD